jgi:hypothetical protein
VEGRDPIPTLAQLANDWGKLPPLPDGTRRRRGRELGDTFHWGDRDDNHPDGGVPQAIHVIAALTREQIDSSALTVDEALLWAQAYEVEAQRMDIDNVSAGPRAQLLRCIAKLLERADLTLSPDDCCAEELAWRHPPHPQRKPLDPRRL